MCTFEGATFSELFLFSDLSSVRDPDGGYVGRRVPTAQLQAAQDVLLPRRAAPRARVAQTHGGKELNISQQYCLKNADFSKVIGLAL